MKIRFEWSTREAYLLDKLEQKTIGHVRKLLTKTKTKLQNIMDKIKATTITEEQYDDLWSTLEDKLDDMYCNEPEAWDIDEYEFEVNGRELELVDVRMGYNHHTSAKKILELLIEEDLIKLKKTK
tara:strand:- start:2560 stop:2934 length:375 start_codon:yes stop_codon:yes gene_type:complete